MTKSDISMLGAPDATYKSLQGKKVLITGGSAGIGKATAESFSANGAIVTITGRRMERLEAVTKTLKTKAFAVVADLGKISDCKRTVDEAVEKMGGLDILVNSGGVWTEAMLTNPLGEQAFVEGMTMHVVAVAQLIEEALPHLTKSGNGAVVNVSSISAIQINLDSPSYNICKAAQDHLTKTLAKKYTSKGVRINSVNPGYVDTEVFDVMVKDTGKPREELLKWAGTENELGRVSTPMEIAGPILFLASDAASFISGVHLPICGAAIIQAEIEMPE